MYANVSSFARLCRSRMFHVSALAACAVAVISLAKASDQSERSKIEYANELLIQLAVSDLERSMQFYGNVLELKLLVHNPDLEWAKYETSVPGVRIGIGRQDVVTGSGSTSINLSVKDVDAARRLLEGRAVKFPKPTVNIADVVKLAEFADPDGNRLRLAGPPDDAEPSAADDE